MLRFDKPSFDEVSSKEWIVTNGIGGYASSTLCGANTRRYHGVLVAAQNPPAERIVCVSTMEEKIITAQREIYISSNQYPDAVHPQGFLMLSSFDRSILPVATFSDHDFTVSKTVFMIYGSNTTVIEYHNGGAAGLELEIYPMMVCRDYHHLLHSIQEKDFVILTTENMVSVNHHHLRSPVRIHFQNGDFVLQQNVYRDFQYNHERERGLDDQEDALCPGYIRFKIPPGQSEYVILTTEDHLPEGTAQDWRSHEELRLKELGDGVSDPFLRDLMISGDQFLVWRKSTASYSILAGYHWFTDWGRDTMIAMRGLVIARGKKKIAESIFRTYLRHLDGGMIPNRFPDQGTTPEYNTIDASLWLFIALHEYYEHFKDTDFIRQVFPALTDIIHSHLEGTRYHIHVTKKGLLSGGDESVQLTWMDAKVGHHVVTPRHGCAVEINALWYNALMIYAQFGQTLGDNVSRFVQLAEKAKRAFREFFINTGGYLNDVVHPGKSEDNAIRPNQLYAISLPFPMLTPGESKEMLRVIDDHLYTDYGLRSLSPSHKDFKAVYTGDQWHRDHAYHQGTVWTYLWGEYAIAFLKVHHFSSEAKSEIRSRAVALRDHFYNHDCLYALSEIFDGGSPAGGKGCVQQAWSVGMTLKALMLCEDQ